MENKDRVREEEEIWLGKAKVNEVGEATAQIGSVIKPLYTPLDLESQDFIQDIGFPGQFPFTRGIYPLMYRGRPWDVRQYSGFGTAEDTNQRWKALLASGEKSVSLANDLPTQLGYDSDDISIEDEVGRMGCAVDTLRDLEILLDGIPLDKIPVTFNQSSEGPFFLAGLIAVAEKQGVDQSQLMGTISNSTLMEYACRGNWIYAPEPSMRISSDIAEYCCRHLPRYYPYNLYGTNLRGAGAELDQEIGYTFAIALTHIDDLLARGLSIDDVAPKMTFFFSSGVRIFEQAAKLRAARRLWAKIIKERYDPSNDASMRMRMTVLAPNPVEYALIEPELNLVRSAFGLLAGALGGAQSMWSPSIDEGYAIPTEKTAHWAIRANQITFEETDAAKTVDPLAGSYFVESLTNEYERRITERLEEIELQGGALKSLEMGYMQRKLTENAVRYQRDLESGKKVIVGTNKYRLAELEEEPLVIHKTDPDGVRLQVERLRQVKSERDEARVRLALEHLSKVAEGSENIMQPMLEAVKAYATIGEITATLKDVFGVYREPVAAF